MGQRKSGTGYAGAVAIVAGATAISAILQHRSESSDLTMLYLLGVVISAIAFGRGPAIVAALLSVAVFDFLFVPPRFTLRVSEARYLVTFAVMLVVAVITGTLTARLREQREHALLRERRIAALYRLSQDLALRSGVTDVLEAAITRIGELPGIKAAALLPDGRVVAALGAEEPGILEAEPERAAAQSALVHGRPIGFPYVVPAGVRGLHIPLVAGTKVNAVLSLSVSNPQALLDPERMEMIRAFSSLTALALERCSLADDSRHAQTQIEAERARSALLSSVSHDLRTPLAAITGAASTLRDEASEISEGARRELADTISEEAERLNRLIGNLLDMTRLESGTLRVKKEWHSLEEVVGASLTRLGPELAGREVHVSLAPDLPLIPMDDVLFEQVVRNLVENGHKYSSDGPSIDIRAVVSKEELRLEVADRGEGLAAGEEKRVFDKFYRGSRATTRPGAGLGLAICRGIVEAHGGTIVAAKRPGGGSLFTVRLPLEGTPPAIERENANDPSAMNGA
jgi:two-component system, OmpR family, sensor histidine kinase KdpD